jgi:hypothetical protein
MTSDAHAEPTQETFEMNEELVRWIKESMHDIDVSKTSKTPSDKEEKKPVGKCHVCGEKDAKFTCIKCDNPVCTDCYFHLVSLCKKCLSQTIAEKWKGKKPDWEKTLGVEWID